MSKTARFQLWVPGEPVGQSHRRLPSGVVTRSKRTKEYTQTIQEVWMLNGRPHFSMDEPVPFRLSLSAYFKRPKNHLDKYGLPTTRKAKDTPYPLRKPDITNIAKVVEDALNGNAWLDDAHVVEETIRKEWAREAGPGVEIVAYLEL